MIAWSLLVLACAEQESPCPPEELYTPKADESVEAGEECEGVLVVCNEETCDGEPGALYCETFPDRFTGWLMSECDDCEVVWDEALAMEVVCPG